VLRLRMTETIPPPPRTPLWRE